MQEELQKILAPFKGEKKDVIPMLQAVQSEYGYLPEEAFAEIGRHSGVPESKVYGTATFYSQFYFSPRGDHEIKVCLGTACHVKGAGQIMDSFERELGICCGETTSDYKYSLERVNCVGSCALAPVVMVGDDVYGRLEPKKVKEVLDKSETEV